VLELQQEMAGPFAGVREGAVREPSVPLQGSMQGYGTFELELNKRLHLEAA
jgi:hypothetical protein